jgi:uncharacterized membrane-anchored protein YjiN (DUF445 family)
MEVTSLDFQPVKEAELRRMKLLASALFWVATLIFVLGSILEDYYPWIGFIRATAEAAMVGAIADWFAVTALFRHPLNLKIPHTAIIPTRKDSIGRSFGHFVKTNFLSGEVISSRLRGMNLTRQVFDWISRAENSRLLADYIAVGLAAVVKVMKDEDVQGLIERNLASRLRSTPIAPLLGKGLSLVMSGNREQELLNGALKLGAHLLRENKTDLMSKISRETPWWLPPTVDRAIYEKIVEATDKVLQEVSNDPKHPLHQKFSEVMDQFVEDLQTSPDVAAREEAWKEELLQQPVVQEFASSLWQDIKTLLLEYDTHPDSDIRQPIQRGLIRFSEAVLENETMVDKINGWLEGGALHLIREYGHEVEQLISQTISNWDAEETSRKIELHVGKDLQFIRINGTLVGGLVGLVIYTISLWL